MQIIQQSCTIAYEINFTVIVRLTLDWYMQQFRIISEKLKSSEMSLKTCAILSVRPARPPDQVLIYVAEPIGLRMCFQRNKISHETAWIMSRVQTNIGGDVLLVVNPYQDLAIYGAQV